MSNRCPVGLIHRTAHWLVEHCVGPLGLGTVIVKPERHITAVAELTDAEAVELGPLLKRASAVARQLVDADQVYNCLWSHAGRRPVHIHYVIQPVTKEQMDDYDAAGPTLSKRRCSPEASSSMKPKSSAWPSRLGCTFLTLF